MADSKLTGLTANTTPALTDLVYLVDDPGGTTLSQKITVGNLLGVASPTLVTPNIGVATGTSLFLTLPSSGRFLELTPASTGEAVNFGFLYNKSIYASGGLGNEAYINDVVTWGWNLVDTVGVAGVAGKASTAFVIENKFFTNKYQSEVHIGHVDTAGVYHRPYTFSFPHDGGIGSSGVYSVDLVNFANWAGTPRIQWHLLNKVADFYDSFVLRANTNNVPFLQQLNAAANAFLNFPYFNDENRLAGTSAIEFIGATPTTGDWPNYFAVLGPTTFPNNGTILGISGPALTGNGTIIQGTLAATGNAYAAFANQNAGAGATMELTLTTSGGGDVYSLYSMSSGMWTFGIDNSDSDKFKFTRDGYPSSGTAQVIIDASGNFTVTGLVTGSSFKSGAPAGGTSGTWKLGVAASVSPTAPDRTIEVDIGGTIYYLHAKTTNN